MNLVILLIAMLLLLAVVCLLRIERHLSEAGRLQRAATSVDVTKRLENEQLEAALFKQFIKEDFSRSEKGEREQQEEFRRWKVSNTQEAEQVVGERRR